MRNDVTPHYVYNKQFLHHLALAKNSIDAPESECCQSAICKSSGERESWQMWNLMAWKYEADWMVLKFR